MTMLLERTWIDACDYTELQPERGVRILFGDTHVAIFRTFDGDLHAVDAVDPFSGASVLARGIVGSCGGNPVVVSPMYKQRFDLRTGVCVEDPSVQLRVYPTEVTGGRVRVGSP
jgi:nitrite reductase (NADH) small subunit